ncbi:DUF4384 domain-containing protein [Limnospira platensis]|uniref:DUF4384 domain-containing protein n=1 Tax=Limnospira platensis TaxID=118562 RepID=UPI00028045E4|nr:hypothetical protein SPLC1_S032880 [Arthrospira platensis C1]UWU50023.1 protein of unknown function (DUF4384) [Arthrospira platensis C1]
METFNIKVVEAMDIPTEYELAFLRKIAEQLDLQPLTVDIFTNRLLQDNFDANWEQVVTTLKQKVPANAARQHYWSREILPKLKELGFSYQEGSKKLWVEARQWLAQTQYGGWLWEQLSQQSQRTQQMGFLEVGVDHLGARREPSKRYQDKVRLDSEVILEINLTATAYLTLLEREPNGTVVCLCPSEYAPNTLLSPKTEKIPQPSAPYPTFAATELGKEQWIALLTLQSPPFEWLKQSRWEAMELQPSHLQQVFEYVKTNQGRLLYTEYEVV